MPLRNVGSAENRSGAPAAIHMLGLSEDRGLCNKPQQAPGAQIGSRSTQNRRETSDQESNAPPPRQGREPVC